MDFCKRVENRNSRRAGGSKKLICRHVIDVFAPMQFVNDLVDLCLCGVHHRCFERFIVLSVRDKLLLGFINSDASKSYFYTF